MTESEIDLDAEIDPAEIPEDVPYIETGDGDDEAGGPVYTAADSDSDEEDTA